MYGLLVVNGFIHSQRFEVLYNMFIKAFEEKGIQIEVITNDLCLVYIDKQIDKHFDFILFWDKDVLLAKHLENLGFSVFNNAKAIAICDDKGLTAITLENHNIPMPKTILAPFTFSNVNYNININDKDSFLNKVANDLGFPLILKENKGSFGNEVYKIDDYDMLLQKVNQLSGKSIHFQEFIDTSFGQDVRIIVVGHEVIGAVKRIGLENEFRSNVLQGGHMESFIPSEDYISIAIEVSKIIGLDFGAIDFMIGRDNKPILCEVNSNVHFKTFYSVTGINMASFVAKHIIKILNK